MAIGRLITSAPGDEWGPLPPHARPRSSRGWRRAERPLFAIGFAALAYFGFVSAEQQLYQELENRELDAILASAPPPLITDRHGFTDRPERHLIERLRDERIGSQVQDISNARIGRRGVPRGEARRRQHVQILFVRRHIERADKDAAVSGGGGQPRVDEVPAVRQESWSGMLPLLTGGIERRHGSRRSAESGHAHDDA